MTLARAPELDELRSRVDRIDESILDLLGERVRVVLDIARVKEAGGARGLALRPGREALIIRRLLERSDGPLPKAGLVRMWRELFAAMTRVQTPFSVCTYVPPDQPALWDIARDHFGSLTPLQRAESPGHALRLAAAGTTPIAVLPLPREAERWWAALLDAAPAAPRVVARLPFAPLPGYPEDVGGLVVAALPPPEPTGDDLTLFAFETDGSVSASRLRDLLGPFAPRWLAGHRDPDLRIGRHLVELAGFLAPDDPRLGEALRPLSHQLLRKVSVGCYARPLPAAELA